MSLTSQLKDHSSPIGAFFRTRFSHTSSISHMANPQLRAAQQILPQNRESYPYSLIGMAVDYRLRYYFTITQEDGLVANAGAAKLIRRIPEYSVQTMQNFFAGLSQALENVQPCGRMMKDDAEILLARYCFVLALFETVYRSGLVPEMLFVPDIKATVEDLLGTAQDCWIEDICAISRLFYRTQPHLLTKPFILNPTFTGSTYVGGADADLIVDGCLLEIKTSVQNSLDTAWLRQLVGYALLDYDDKYSIQSVGIYMARHGILLKWPIEEYLRLLAGDDDVSLISLRQELSKAIEQYGVIRSERIALVEKESLAELAMRERAGQMSEEGRCLRCGETLSFTEERAAESITKRGTVQLTDIVTLRCPLCDVVSIARYGHPKSPRTDLDKLTQSRRIRHIFDFNLFMVTVIRRNLLDSDEPDP